MPSHTAGPLILAAGAVVLLALSRTYRLPETFLPAVSAWGLGAVIWPALMPPVRADVWDLAGCVGATAICAVTACHASRTRAAQLRPGWWSEVQQLLEEGSD